ncbi:MAG: tetratricopeptide repeat protein [Deltaproteobacteria bacterium]|nr:tetratricopeptide repeat protein [Deltaproteobacteria bacterium]
MNYGARHKFKEAKEEFEKALKIDPFDTAAKEALKVIEAAISNKIKSKTAIHLFKGIEHDNKDKLDKAITEFNKAIKIDPSYAEDYFTRGTTYDTKGQCDNAISDLSKAIELNPGYAEAYNNRGITYVNKGQYDQAISDFTKAIQINPKDAEVYYNRGLSI